MLSHEELKALETFLDKEIDAYISMANYPPQSIKMSCYLFPSFFAMFAHSPFSVNSHVYYRGCIVEEEKGLKDNEVRINGELKEFNAKGTQYHWCESNLVRYVGFTHIYDYCKICDKKFVVEMVKKC